MESWPMCQGTDLGPLQGIPYGLKDLIAVEGYRTTWGAPAYMDQVLESSANVYKRSAPEFSPLLESLSLHDTPPENTHYRSNPTLPLAVNLKIVANLGFIAVWTMK